jgi:protein-disulfide isomerase
MVLLTVGAVAIGLVVILVASGVLGGRGNGSAGELLVPIRPAPATLVDPTNPRALGRADAPVTIDVWSDFQCPACGFLARQVEPDLIDEFVANGTVRLVYRDFAFLDRGDPNGESQQSAAAARCAGEQAKFWPFHDYLFENQKDENAGNFRRERLDAIAAAIGLDRTAFDACMSGDGPEQAVAAETKEGEQAGVGSTPTLTVNGVLQRPGALPLADLRVIIELELQKLAPSPDASASAAPSPTPAP